MPKALAQFSITRSGENYLLSIEDQNGETIELTADYDQLDLITEAIEQQLDADEEADEENALDPDDETMEVGEEEE